MDISMKTGENVKVPNTSLKYGDHWVCLGTLNTVLGSRRLESIEGG